MLGFDASQSSIPELALLGQLAVIVLGTLVVTSEHSTGMITATLVELPRSTWLPDPAARLSAGWRAASAGVSAPSALPVC